MIISEKRDNLKILACEKLSCFTIELNKKYVMDLQLFKNRLSTKYEFKENLESKIEKTLNELWNENGFKVSDGFNLIIAPCGSGKTYFVFNTLIKEMKLEEIVYLCDTRNLKNAVALDKEYHHLCRFYDMFDADNVVSEYKLEKYWGKRNGNEGRITVMTYAQFGLLAKKYPYAFRYIKMVICDEAHQAIDYSRKFDNEKTNTYQMAIKTVNQLAEQAKVVLLTATPKLIDRKRIATVFDFSSYSNIRRLKQNNIIGFNSSSDIDAIVREFKNQLKYKKIKMLIYTDRITTVNAIVENCNRQGLMAVGLWSLNNKDNIMDTYQLKCLKSVIKESLIPEELDVLVINASLQTGINIKNDDIDWVIVNSRNETTQIQARSRVRRDIDMLFLKTLKVISQEKLTIESKWQNRVLYKNDKQQLSKELAIYNERGRLLKWTSISKLLKESGYIIKNVNSRINGKKIRGSIITTQ